MPCTSNAFRIAPPAILLRESYREGDKNKKRTLANLSAWPVAKIEALRCVPREDVVAPTNRDGLTLMRSLSEKTVVEAGAVVPPVAVP